MKKLAISVIISAAFTIGMAEEKKSDSPWQKEAVGNLNFSHAGNKNWAAGGEKTFSWDLKLNGKIERDVDKNNWKTTGKINYGMSKIGDNDWRKALDEVFLESVYSYKLTQLLNPYVSASAQSQFVEGHKFDDDAGTKTSVSNFWDPGYLTQGAGMGLKPMKSLVTRLGLSLKETFSRHHGYADDEETAGEIEEFKFEPGLESITEFSHKFTDILKYETKLSAFANFKGFKRIDGRWENRVTAQVSKYITINGGWELLYDYDLHHDYQAREDISIGLTYTFL